MHAPTAESMFSFDLTNAKFSSENKHHCGDPPITNTEQLFLRPVLILSNLRPNTYPS